MPRRWESGMGRPNTRAEAMRFQEVSSSVEVSADDYEDYARVIAKSLSSGHDAISRTVMEFMRYALSDSEVVVKSNFAPFEFQVGSAGDMERIFVELIIAKSAPASFQVMSKKIRNCNVNGNQSQQNHTTTAEVDVSTVEVSPSRQTSDGGFIGYYDTLTSCLNDSRTRNGQNSECNASVPREADNNEICRFCFESECPLDSSSKLVHPCSCSEPIHMQCLRKWQQVQIEQAAQASKEAAAARAATCEICGALLCVDGVRVKPPMRTVICRPDALEPMANCASSKKKSEPRGGKVPLRRFPASTHAPHVFTGTSVEGGQELEVLEQDTSGEFFRVRVLNASRYQDPQGHDIKDTPVSVAHGWIQHVYLEWPHNSFGTWTPPTTHAENPPCNPKSFFLI